MARHKEYDEKEVLQKATELFRYQGYEKTSLQDLVSHMGIHRRSLYDTFGDKHSLFLKALEHYDNNMKKNMDIQVKNSSTAKDAIRSILEMAISQDNEKTVGCLTINSAVELTLHDQEVAEKIEQNFSKTEKIILELLLRGQNSGEIPKHHDIEKLSQFIHNSFVGLRVLVKTTNDKNKLKNIIDTTLSVLD
ncbi:TetR/AcrR family transcriptional regulator [Gottfriedia solisilvae]|uniref:Putative HTH-type transcriptional regulator YezE n=1 Tax=Gottfriedia solisilvae TaxID=1516104 RepID=A0A8J3AG35_9BACI|nr:TetR/AcrR family transcriptional regulator [Gottfriedia solisilvae]GGI12653.1 putative HTH-type transcriptional regulator YezE [Gottfriedia solisilvae]